MLQQGDQKIVTFFEKEINKCLVIKLICKIHKTLFFS